MSFRTPSLRAAVILLAAFLTVQLSAQRNCGSMDYLQQQIQDDPDRGEFLQNIDQHAHDWAVAHGDEERAVVVIPVVFHVVYNTAAQNISDALINAQIAQLNADFARLNSDASQTPSIFTGVAANTEIQFCLAQRDPSGNPTTGIVRRQTTVTSFSSNDAVKYTSSGGSNAWPRDSYLNIWTCNLGGGLLGYAQFPGGAAATDGVVVLFSSVGSLSTPGTASPFHYGRTLTHEVGHWLNLRHIWGDANCGNDQFRAMASPASKMKARRTSRCTGPATLTRAANAQGPAPRSAHGSEQRVAAMLAPARKPTRNRTASTLER